LREQWALDDLAWSSIDFTGLPAAGRGAGASALAQILCGERTARAAASRLLLFLADDARALGEIQVRDEQRHVAFFERVIARLGLHPDEVESEDVGGLVRPSVAALLADVRSAETPEALALGMHLVVEGAGHALFAATGRVFGLREDSMAGAHARSGVDEAALQSVRAVAGDWMPRLLGRDEGRHIALGLAFLHQRLPRATLGEVARLEELVERWGDVIVGCARDPDVVRALGVDARSWCARIVDELNRRVSQVGLETRFPPLEES
jgi:hypothetical protein